ncbi:Tex family protein [Anaerofustis stercorihominis]|uniref:RNA-binding transcriptional accessory protein n=1 Tax=Anaerofustis stercorihominis TaxID=214853 RepID=A0A3E3DYL2_9FIRM|nr:Tex family protein [Anaerofustis stercorihominis]RGD74374.1 RNA-binding transcriptional accessory protein [Anaerofustis stercorihominis]
MQQIIETLASEFNQNKKHIENVIELLNKGDTVPFIARYRKELTGSMDDQLLREITDRLNYLINLNERKEEVKKSIASLEKLTGELEKSIDDAKTLSEVEDLYRPYKPKRKTRASIAKEKGLEPLSDLIISQNTDLGDITELAKDYINEENGVNNEEEAIKGALDIIAESISDDAGIRKELKQFIRQRGKIASKNTKDEDSVYATYSDFSEGIKKLAGHKVLALNRGEKEGFLKVGISVDKEQALDIIHKHVIKNNKNSAYKYMIDTCIDAYDRLLFPSIEREIRNDLTDTANESAIKTFSTNLRQLLMQPPVKNKVTLGLDPAYRTGCKIAVVDGTGKVLDTTVIYPTPPHNKIKEAEKIINALIAKYNVEIISIGNGTASRESEKFVADTIKGTDVQYMIVNEAGASVYSASKLAAKEFPDFDVALRSAVSIARRLQDPLAELVKIDPKSIGVGQYQHDMPKARLNEALTGVVESVVNSVGVDLNTASVSLLEYVAGISSAVAKNIVAYREENGIYNKRSELLKVPKLGKKSYEQCAGFLRVAESSNPLDNSGVHPETYKAAKNVLELTGHTLKDVNTENISDLEEEAKKIGLSDIAEKCEIGIPTLKDILKELIKPGRDPREDIPAPILRSDVLEMEDLIVGMKLKGTVRNVVDFGAFVDIGVHQDGLVHISQISNTFIKHPSDILKTGDIVEVTVLDVNKDKNRISLSMIR